MKDAPAYPLISCNECKGTGALPPWFDSDCCHCDGTGRVCENCEGYSIEYKDADGFTNYYCEACEAS